MTIVTAIQICIHIHTPVCLFWEPLAMLSKSLWPSPIEKQLKIQNERKKRRENTSFISRGHLEEVVSIRSIYNSFGHGHTIHSTWRKKKGNQKKGKKKRKSALPPRRERTLIRSKTWIMPSGMAICIKQYQEKGNEKMSPSQGGPSEVPTSILSKALIMPSGMVWLLNTHLYIHIPICTCMHTHMQTHIHVYTYPYTCVYTYPYSCVYIPISKWIWNASIQSYDSHLRTYTHLQRAFERTSINTKHTSDHPFRHG